MVLSWLGASAFAQIPASYNFVIYDTPGATSTQINSVNDRGDIVGYYFTPDAVSHAYLRQAGSSTVIALTAPEGNGASRPVINSKGQIAFTSGTSIPGFGLASTTSSVYLRSADGQQATKLTTINGDCIVTGVNDQAQVIGYAVTPGVDIPFLVNSDGSVPDIRLNRLRNFGINNAGQVLWIGNKAVLLANRDGTASGKRLDLSFDVANAAMSNNGLVAGTYPGPHGFVGDLGSNVYSMLDVPGYAGQTVVYGVNDFGVVVGTAGSYPNMHGFIATPAPTVPALSPGGVTNAASYANAAVSPGEVVVLFGTGLGPPALTPAPVDDSGFAATSVLTTRVLFDGIPAPLIYVRGNQVVAVVPYEVAGAITQVQVEYQGNRSNPVAIPVAPSAPGIFTVDGTGVGPGVVLNQDGSINTAINPAQRGDIVVFYATGLGQTLPASITGRTTPLNLPVILQQPLPITVMIGNSKARILYDGPAPATIAGISQINVIVPLDAPYGSTVPLTVQAGSAVSRPVTVALK
jgi:uncharacterized protein (TIGR03437 family)